MQAQSLESISFAVH